MSNVQSYNALIDRFKAFASGHFILKSFSHGQIDTADLEKFTEYPFMHVVPSNVTYAKGTKTFSFQIVLADLPRDKDDKVEFQREVLSDLQRIAEDLVAEITNHRVLFGDLITVQNVSLEPFLEEFHNTLTGWTVSLELLVPYYWDACSIPAEWNDFFESGSGGTGSILTFIDSITRDEYGNVSLVNDEATPAPNYYYGTNEEGVRGWYLLTDEVGLTCATIGTCQTIIDIESAIDDLQTEIALKGDMFKSVYDTDVDGVVDSAERIQIVVRNSTGSTLTKGQIVYLSGATGNRPNAVLAQANTEMTSSKTIGMVIADIANNADGQVAVNGTLHDLDTSAFTAGDTLWLSATTAGGMVANTPPAEPNHAVFIGYVARSHPNLGRVVLAIQNGYELDELHGVQITTPSNNDGLFFESSTSLWKNKSISTVLGYTPFNLPSLTSGSVLFSNGTTIAQDNANLFWDDTNNRLGIGTNAPRTNKILDMLFSSTGGGSGIGLRNTNNAGFTEFVFDNDVTPTTEGAFVFGYGGSNSPAGANVSYFFQRRNAPILFGSNNLERMRIVGNGNILIGTTTDAGFKLDVNGTARVQGNAQFGTGFYWDNTNARLGIGTASPGVRLHVYGTNELLRFGDGTSGNDAFMSFNDRGYVGFRGAGGLNFIANTSRPIIFGIGSTFSSFTESARFAGSTGNFLINTTTDAGYRLDVNGTARVSGTGVIGGTPFASSRLEVGSALGIASQEILLALNKSNSNDRSWKFLLGKIADTQWGNYSLRIFNGGYSGDLVLGLGAGRLRIGAGFPDTADSTTNFTDRFIVQANGNVGIGTTTDIASSKLTIESTTQGFLPPRMTTTQKNAIASPAAGLVVYDTTLGKLCVRTATAWETITSI